MLVTGVLVRHARPQNIRVTRFAGHSASGFGLTLPNIQAIRMLSR